MALIKTVRGLTPKFGKNCYLAENATIVGEVEMGDDCSIWFSAVVRGDVNSIKIGNRVNIQDGVILHTLYKKSAIEIGNDVSIGHNAVIHGAILKDNVLIGMGAIVLDDAVIESNTVVAAGSVVKSGTITDSYSIWAGIPAKKVKTITPAEAKEFITHTAENYVMYAGWFQEPEKK
jgi:carbonic anhydrase/acetyltransferase-like protein (isoleucine patch superfamily)